MTDPNTAPSEIVSPEIIAEPPVVETPEAQPQPETEQAAEPTPEERIKKLEKALERKQRAIDRRTAELYAERRLKEQNGGTPQPKPNPSQPSDKLNPNDFETIEDYVDAVAERKAKAATKEAREEFTRQTNEEREVQTAYRQHQEFHAKIETAREKFTDFDKVTQEYADEYAAPHIQKLIMEADDAGEALYLIAKEDVLSELNDMTTYKASLRIAELVKKSSETVKPVTKAPAPMSALKGKSGGSTRTVLDMNTSDEILNWIKS